MKHEEIIEMARQAGWSFMEVGLDKQRLEAFAKLVAAKERESCAKELEEYAKRHRNLHAKGMTDLDHCVVYTLETNAYLLRTRFYENHEIRARGEA